MFAFTGADGRQRISSTAAGICSQARTYARKRGLRPSISEVLWRVDDEEWVSRERADLMARAYRERAA